MMPCVFPLPFESDVISDSGKTRQLDSASLGMFESDVISDSGKTIPFRNLSSR